jgi:hypothetical protein
LLRNSKNEIILFEHRLRIEEYLTESPSLNNYLPEVFINCYENARKQAAIETGLSVATFPVESPFTIDECLDKDFLPN